MFVRQLPDKLMCLRPFARHLCTLPEVSESATAAAAEKRQQYQSNDLLHVDVVALVLGAAVDDAGCRLQCQLKLLHCSNVLACHC